MFILVLLNCLLLAESYNEFTKDNECSGREYHSPIQDIMALENGFLEADAIEIHAILETKM